MVAAAAGALAAAGAFLAAWVQHKGWTYHASPVLMLAPLAIAAATGRRLDAALPLPRAVRAAPALGALSACVLFAYAARGGEVDGGGVLHGPAGGSEHAVDLDAGGASIALPQGGYRYQPGLMLSPTGECRAFDATADGAVPGNGVGIVVLKPLAQALADGDTVYAVIRGSALNNDGATKMTYAAPTAAGLGIENLRPGLVLLDDMRGRPDVDSVYMTVTQAMTGQVIYVDGGWLAAL